MTNQRNAKPVDLRNTKCKTPIPLEIEKSLAATLAKNQIYNILNTASDDEILILADVIEITMFDLKSGI